MQLARRLLCLAFLLVLALPVLAQSDKRVALVVGNAAYSDGTLRHPVNDARAIAAKLQSLGFEVTLRTDGDRSQLASDIEDLGRRATRAEAALFYFSGQAVQVRGRNYLLPVGQRFADEVEVETSAVDVDRVMARLEDAGAQVKLLILDACCGKPLTGSDRSGTRGLVAVQPPSGALVALAAEPGTTASDGNGGSSPFSSALLRHIATPDLPVEQMLRRVRDEVAVATGGRQVARYASNLTVDFSFAGNAKPPTVTPSRPVTGERNHAVVTVFFGTDRSLTSSHPNSVQFGAHRGSLTLGTADVSIPRDHRMGNLESPSILRLEFREDPSRHVSLLSTRVASRDVFFAEFAKRLRSSEAGDALLFIHGYNVSFADAARRTAQISYDLGFSGVPMFYSWPSQGSTAQYTVDEQNIEWSQSNLRLFLLEVLSRPDLRRMFVIAHSMGNRAMTRALVTVLAEQPGLGSKVSEIILAAPDIDAEVFRRDIAPALTRTQRPITLYASSGDVALAASKQVHGYARAGDAGSGLIVVAGIETVDATAVDTGFLGHSYFADRKSVLSDLFSIVRAGKRASERFGLEQVATPAGPYWVFRP